MEKTLQEVLHENKMKMWQKEKARLRKKEKKETILFTCVALFIVTITIVCMVATNNDMKTCEELHNASYCMENL